MRRKQKNIVLQNVTVDAYAAEGKSLARLEGKVIFIEKVVPGDVVDVQLTKSKKDWGEGHPIKFHEYSKERVTPFCQHFGVCGGCQWQMLPYEKQLEFKQQQVKDNLQRIGKVALPEFLPIAGAADTKFYRNKLEYTFSTKEFTQAPPPPKGGIEAPSFGYETEDPMVYSLLKEFVRKHRSQPTVAENAIWERLRGDKTGYKFRRQHIIGSYIADFINLNYKLVIEVEGLIHQLPENKESDQQRTDWLNSQGYEVLRFTNDQVIQETNKVVEQIRQKLEESKSRNASQIPPLGGGGAVGFHARGFFDKVVAIEKCWLQEDLTNAIRNSIRDYARQKGLSFYDIRNHTGLLRTMQVRLCTTGEVMVNIVLGEEQEANRLKLLQFVKDSFPQITTLLYTINLKWNDSMHDLEPQVFSGKGYVVEQLEDFRFKIGPKSFFQTNTKQGERLYQITRDFAELDGSQVVYDLYCGTGSIGIFCSRGAKKIIGVEVIEAAIADAKENATLNKIEHSFFTAGDVIDVCNDEFFQTHGKPDVLITDPPRAGMHEKLVQKILDMEAPTVVYVSCNPATQARDLALLDAKYAVTKVQPVDMFPHTHHIENVVQLKLKTTFHEQL